MTTYETKDSGVHQQYESGMRRDSQDGKPRFDLIRTKLQPYEEQMIYRYAMLLARGAEKYDARNWEDGCGEEELDRAKASLLRHTEQLVAGETDEDHAAAVWFNTQAIEYFRWRLHQDEPKTDEEARERARVAHNSEVRHAALQKATELRRRERLRGHAKEFDAELTVEAQNLKRETIDLATGEHRTRTQSGKTEALADGVNRLVRGLEEVRRTGGLPHVHAPSVEMPEAKVDPIIDVNDDGSPVRESDLARNRRSGAIGLFQFMDNPSWGELGASYRSRLEAQKASEELITREPSPDQVNEDGTVTLRKIDYSKVAVTPEDLGIDTHEGVDQVHPFE